MKVSDSLPPDPPTKFLDGFALGFPMIRVPDEMERPFESEGHRPSKGASQKISRMGTFILRVIPYIHNWSSCNRETVARLPVM